MERFEQREDVCYVRTCVLINVDALALGVTSPQRVLFMQFARFPACLCSTIIPILALRARLQVLLPPRLGASSSWGATGCSLASTCS